MRPRRARRPAWAVDPHDEKVLAAAEAEDLPLWLLGTRSHLAVVPDPERLADEAEVWRWEEVQTAHWDRDTGRLRVEAVGSFGRPRPVLEHVVPDGERLLQLVRERVTASVVLRRRVEVEGRRGFDVIGRRNPVGGEVQWMHQFDPGVEPDDPTVAGLAAAALAAARAELGSVPAGTGEEI